MLEAAKDLKVDRDKTSVRPLSRTIISSQGKNQGGNQG